VLFVEKKLTTEDTKKISHKGHGEGFIYGKGNDFEMSGGKRFFASTL